MSESYRPEPPEAEALPALKILFAGLAALALFALASLGAWSMVRAWGRQSATPEPVGREQIGGVEQRLFSESQEARERNARSRVRLTSYGWADRKRNLAHIPIDVAIEKFVRQEQERTGGAP